MSKGDDTRGRILEAAVACLADGGIEEVRIARVARRAGVSTGLVHYHFDTREALLEQALEASFEVAGEVRLSTRYGSGTAVQRLRRKLEASFPFPGRQAREWELWVELWLRAVRDPALRSTAADLYAQLQTSWISLITEAVEDGEIELADPQAAATRVLAAIDGFGVRALIGDPALPVDVAFEHAWRVLAAELGLDP